MRCFIISGFPFVSFLPYALQVTNYNNANSYSSFSPSSNYLFDLHLSHAVETLEADVHDTKEKIVRGPESHVTRFLQSLVVCLNHVEPVSLSKNPTKPVSATSRWMQPWSIMQQIRQLEPRLQEDKQPNQVLMNKMDTLGRDFSDMGGGAIFQNQGGSTGEA
jgi:hypothetical protein